MGNPPLASAIGVLRCFEIRAAAAVLFLVAALPVLGVENVYLTEVPDYEWYEG